MAVDGGAHLLSHQQGGNLLLRGNKLTSLGLLQGFPDETGVALDVCARKALTYPESDQMTHLLHIYFVSIKKAQAVMQTHTHTHTPLEVEAEVSENGSTG